jgi:PmbA protein
VDLERWIARIAEDPAVAAWSVHAVSARAYSVGTRDGETGIPHAPATSSEGISLAGKVVWSDGRVSRWGGDRSTLQDPFDAWRRDAAAVAHDDPDGTSVGTPAAMPDTDLHSEPVAAVARGDPALPETWLRAARARVGPGAARTWSGAMRAVSGESRVVTSAGVDVRTPWTLLSWHATFDAESDCGRSSRSADGLEDCEARLEHALEMLRLLRTGSGLRGGPETPVLLHPDVVARWVVPALLHNLSGRAVARGESAFRIEDFRDGASVLREDLSLELDPLRPLHPGSFRFTPEGIPASRVTLVEKGRLVTPILDLKHAKRLGMVPTVTPLGADSVVLSGPEVLDLTRAFGRARGGLLVLRVLGVHTLDPASGDFSLSAPQSLALTSEGPVGRVRANLVGNLFGALRDPYLALVDVPGEPHPGILLRCKVDARSGAP